jgi:hypothetical protein
MSYETWVATLPKCIGGEQGCDGSLVGLEHEKNCLMFGKEWATMRDAYNAGAASCDSRRTC